MKDKLIIVANGEGTRWGNYRGTPKHLLEINGEPLLHRTVRLFTGFDIVIVSSNPAYDVKGAVRHGPPAYGLHDVNTECLGTEPFWNREGRTVIVLGDIWFSDEAVETIKNHKDKDLHFFGRKDASSCNGKGWGELFAQSFYPEHFEAYKDAYEKSRGLKDLGKLDRDEWWEHYRVADGIDPRRHETGSHFTEIDDFSDDFDYPSDYDVWQSNWEKLNPKNDGTPV
jgi:hypothetical protein